MGPVAAVRLHLLTGANKRLPEFRQIIIRKAAQFIPGGFFEQWWLLGCLEGATCEKKSQQKKKEKYQEVFREMKENRTSFRFTGCCGSQFAIPLVSRCFHL
ncbi:hypothetical protein LGV61_06185 [Desulfurispirillum indicum]|uniref:hypothetical protein n=1 Tax=Desulfurispirillum indicum TaxID=936456 RepID=UPI001CF9FB8C|nr:hypothetical protein [Desulfurispirillum indicum]UCZ57855.1 hypothetical protein LGV61_06185 [Desulfurispirillum indicum]